MINEIDFWKELSRQGYTIQQSQAGWCIWHGIRNMKQESPLPDYETHEDAVLSAKTMIGWTESSKFDAALNRKYKATVLYNAGYGKQCVDLELFEADSKEEAQKKGMEKAESFFKHNPKAEIIEVKIKKWKQITQPH